MVLSTAGAGPKHRTEPFCAWYPNTRPLLRKIVQLSYCLVCVSHLAVFRAFFLTLYLGTTCGRAQGNIQDTRMLYGLNITKPGIKPGLVTFKGKHLTGCTRSPTPHLRKLRDGGSAVTRQS